MVLECQPELMRLMRSAEGVDASAGARHAGGRGGDADGRPGLPAGQPARHLHRTARPSCRAKVPYLAPPPGTGEKFAPLLARAEGRLKVGIVWSGSVTFAGNANRSAGLAPYLPLAGIPGVQLIGLQKGPQARRAEGAGHRTR